MECTNLSKSPCWAPELLPVVFCRGQDGDKSKSACSWRGSVQVPVWESAQHRIVAEVLHCRDNTQSGHYRAFWPENLQDDSEVWVCDDYRLPEKITAAEQADIARAVYLLSLERSR